MRTAGWVAALVFLLSAALQWNDPDPLRWMVAYGFAAGIAIGANLGWPVRRAAGAAAVAYALGAVAVAPAAMGVSPAELVAPEMKTAAIEEARESLGLGLCAAWCALVAWRGARRERDAGRLE